MCCRQWIEAAHSKVKVPGNHRCGSTACVHGGSINGLAQTSLPTIPGLQRNIACHITCEAHTHTETHIHILMRIAGCSTMREIMSFAMPIYSQLLPPARSVQSPVENLPTTSVLAHHHPIILLVQEASLRRLAGDRDHIAGTCRIVEKLALPRV